MEHFLFLTSKTDHSDFFTASNWISNTGNNWWASVQTSQSKHLYLTKLSPKSVKSREKPLVPSEDGEWLYYTQAKNDSHIKFLSGMEESSEIEISTIQLPCKVCVYEMPLSICTYNNVLKVIGKKKKHAKEKHKIKKKKWIHSTSELCLF